MPAKPTAPRVAVWRLLKKVGAIYLQQSVCVFPDSSNLRKDLAPILHRIADASGEFHLLPLRNLGAAEGAKLVQQFQEQTSNHYREIIENCEVNFAKEIEFETYRENFTYEEAEEIRTEFEKICAWYGRVQRRDWFGAPNQGEAKLWLDRCEKMLEEFEATVFDRQEKMGTARPPSPGARGRRRRPHLILGSPGNVPTAAGLRQVIHTQGKDSPNS